MTTRTGRAAFTGIIVLAALLFVIPIARREVFLFRDHLVFFLPLRFHTAAVLSAGHLPLWNPYNASGEPWLANPETSVFYPPAWLFLILPFPAAYMLFLAFHIALTGCGAYLLFGRRSIVGAVALMFCGPTLSLLDVSNNLATFAWIPWILWLALRRASGTKGWPLAVDALAIALAFLGGEPFFAALAALIYTIIVRRPRDVAIVAALAIGLCAVQLLPFLEWLRGTSRGVELAPALAVHEGLSFSDWLRIATPPHVTREGEPLLVQQFIAMPYAGLFVPALAVVGIVFSILRKQFRRAAGWIALIAVCIVLAQGSILDLLRVRYPARMMSIAMIGIVALAVIGWDAIRPQRAWLDWIVAVVIALELIPRAMPMLHTIPASELAGPIDPSIGRTSQILRLPIGADAMTDPPAWLFGYQNLYARRFDTGSGSPAVPLRYLQLFQAATKQQRIDVIDRLSAGFIFCDRPLPLPPIARVHDVTIYRNPGALPMARFRTSDGRMFAAAIERIDGSRAEVVVKAPGEGVLTIAQRDAPGWRVFVDGRPQPKLADDGVFRAVALHAGVHRIVWVYRPMTFVVGMWISLAVIIVVAVSIGYRHTSQA